MIRIIDNRDPLLKRFDFGEAKPPIADPREAEYLKDPSMYNVQNDQQEGLDNDPIPYQSDEISR